MTQKADGSLMRGAQRWERTPQGEGGEREGGKGRPPPTGSKPQVGSSGSTGAGDGGGKRSRRDGQVVISLQRMEKYALVYILCTW